MAAPDLRWRSGYHYWVKSSALASQTSRRPGPTGGQHKTRDDKPSHVNQCVKMAWEIRSPFGHLGLEVLQSHDICDSRHDVEWSPARACASGSV